MFLINISSNHREKFFIGAGLNLLSELGDMYVSAVFSSLDRQGSDTPFYNCCVQLACKLTLDELIAKTKEIEKQLGRKPNDKQSSVMPIDIDVLAHKETTNEPWQFLEKRLPLTDDVIWGLMDLEMDFAHVADKTPLPAALDWWN